MSNKKPPTTDRRCGTYAGYKAHYRRGETPCGPCKSAKRGYVQTKDRPVEPDPTVAKPREKPVNVVDVTPPDPTGDRDATGGVLAAPRFLRERGRALWDEVTSQFVLSAGARVSLAEACRIADRLERMSGMLSSRSTLWIELSEDDQDQATRLAQEGVPLVVNNIIGEARQLANQFQSIMRQLGLTDVTVVEEQTVSITDQLAERRRARLDAAKDTQTQTEAQ